MRGPPPPLAHARPAAGFSSSSSALECHAWLPAVGAQPCPLHRGCIRAEQLLRRAQRERGQVGGRPYPPPCLRVRLAHRTPLPAVSGLRAGGWRGLCRGMRARLLLLLLLWCPPLARVLHAHTHHLASCREDGRIIGGYHLLRGKRPNMEDFHHCQARHGGAPCAAHAHARAPVKMHASKHGRAPLLLLLPRSMPTRSHACTHTHTMPQFKRDARCGQQVGLFGIFDGACVRQSGCRAASAKCLPPCAHPHPTPTPLARNTAPVASACLPAHIRNPCPRPWHALRTRTADSTAAHPRASPQTRACSAWLVHARLCIRASTPAHRPCRAWRAVRC